MAHQSDIRPFRIAVAEIRLERLKKKLELTDLPSELETDTSNEWMRGPPTASIRSLLEYWTNTFDWRKAEATLNDLLPQFTTTIPVDGQGEYDIHFVHLRSTPSNAIPLIFLHGWPGSFYEVSKIAHALAESGNGTLPSFHVVAPSLVDHGFSSGSRTTDFHIDQHAEVAHKLMVKLGYNQYVAQGGDTGWLVSRMLALNYPKHCVAHHVNMAVPRPPNKDTHPDIHKQWTEQGGFDGLSESEKTQIARSRNFQKEGTGYFAIHTTRPMALAYSMTDSPVGLLSWIYDKLTMWTDDYTWTADEILTWVSIYHFSTAGPAASFNTYYTSQHRKPDSAFDYAAKFIDSPLGISRFEKEILNMPKMWIPTLGPIVFHAEHARGGHFAAFEVPDVLVGDVRNMFGQLKKQGLFDGMNDGKSRYRL